MIILPKQKIVPKNPKFEWLEKLYPGFLHLIFMQGSAAVCGASIKYDFSYKNAYSIQKDMTFDWFWDLRELERVRNLFIDKAKKDLMFFMGLYTQWEIDHAMNIKAYEKYGQIDFSELSDKELYDAYEEMYQANFLQGSTGYLADAFLSSGKKDWLAEFIAKTTTKDLDETVKILSAPVIASYVNEETIALAKIKNSIKGKWKNIEEFKNLTRNDNIIMDMLKKHAEKFYWIENNYFAKLLKVEDFIKRLYESNGENPANRLEENKKKKEILLAKLDNAHLSNVIKMTELATHMQDYRKMALVRFAHFLDAIFKEITKRRELTMIDLYNTIEPEIKDILIKNIFDKNKLKLRAEKNFIYLTPEGYLVLEGEDYKSYVNEDNFIQTINDVSEVKGVTACKGKVKGIARIIRDANNAGDFNKGDILVTNNTTPEFVPLMKKAAAIVTEQGGITTHAAIISRELGIPCIIGTQIATKAIKDKTKVEVDADKGTVKILK